MIWRPAGALAVPAAVSRRSAVRSSQEVRGRSGSEEGVESLVCAIDRQAEVVVAGWLAEHLFAVLVGRHAESGQVFRDVVHVIGLDQNATTKGRTVRLDPQPARRGRHMRTVDSGASFSLRPPEVANPTASETAVVESATYVGKPFAGRESR